MLILFDIDGTLLRTHGAGVMAMQDAGRELFGPQFTVDGVEFSGRLDPLIWADLAARNGVRDREAHHEKFRATYASHLRRRLDAATEPIALPGVAALLDALAEQDSVHTGLLTGNYSDTGALKLNAAGLDVQQFAVRVWGTDGPTRRDLPPIAVQRLAEKTGRAPGGRSLLFEDVCIIGDTPHDVDCGRAHCCRVLAVATGSYSPAELAECGADLVLENLRETDAVTDWLLASDGQPRGPRRRSSRRGGPHSRCSANGDPSGGSSRG